MSDSILSVQAFETMLENLRAFVVSMNANANADTLHLQLDIAQRFTECRNAFSGEPIMNPKSFLLYSKSVWNIATTLPESHSLHLPPLYTNNEHLERILQHASNELLKRENGKVYGESSNCGHLVIGGIEGVGKSTIAKAIAIACAVLLRRMTPVFYLVNEEPQSWVTISTLLRRRFPSLLVSKFDNASVTFMLEYLSKNGIEVAFFMDEFQRLFVENATGARGKQIVQQMADVSRCCAALGVITGSSVNLRSYLFKWHEGKDPWRTQGYPNFNGTLYRFFLVPALRSKESLRTFLNTRYPQWHLSGGEVEDILKFTGGVGRIIHLFYVDQSLYFPLNNLQITTAAATKDSVATSLLALNDERRLNREQILANDYYRSILTYFAGRCSGNYYASYHKNEISFMLKELFKVNDVEAMKIIDNAVDCGALYQEGFDIQVTIPYDIEYLLTHAMLSIPLLLKLTVVSFMVRGIFERENVIDVNAGNALESLVRGNVLTLLGKGSTKRGVANIEVVSNCLHQGLLRITSSEGIDMQYLQTLPTFPVDIVSVHAFQPFFGIAFKWKNEIRLDAWTVVPSNDDGVALIGWQCKGGRQNVRITPGIEAILVDKYIKSGDLSKVDMSTIAGISVEAQVGFLAIIAALEKIGLHVTEVKLLLTTTKFVTNDAMKIKALSFNADLAEAVMAKKDIKAKRNQLPTISLLTITGTSWITDCVDGDGAASSFCQSLFGKSYDMECGGVSLLRNSSIVADYSRENTYRCVVC